MRSKKIGLFLLSFRSRKERMLPFFFCCDAGKKLKKSPAICIVTEFKNSGCYPSDVCIVSKEKRQRGYGGGKSAENDGAPSSFRSDLECKYLQGFIAVDRIRLSWFTPVSTFHCMKISRFIRAVIWRM